MPPLLFSPLAFYAQVVLLLALAVLLGALVAAEGRPRTPSGRPRADTALVRREAARAVTMGMSPPAWLALRAASSLGGLAVGVAVGTPVVVLGCTAAGVFAVPFVLGPVADRRRLQMERALVDHARSLVELIRTSNQTLDEALADAGRNPPPAVRRVLQPLAETQRSIRDRLLEVDARALSPIANRLCCDLMLALETSPEAFVAEATEVLIPQYESDLTIQERDHAIAQGARQAGYIVGGLMALMFAVVMRVDSFRAAYAAPAGQVVLVVVAALVMLIFWVIGQLTPRAGWVRWNLAEIRFQLERRHG